MNKSIIMNLGHLFTQTMKKGMPSLKYLPCRNHAVNDRKYVFHFRPKPKPKPEKHLALGRIPKPKVQIYVKIVGILVKFKDSNDLSN
jgi:hypothetical protein